MDNYSLQQFQQDDSENIELPLLNAHARIYKLDHSIRVINEPVKPLAKTKIKAFLADSGNNRIYECVFTVECEGQEGRVLRNKR